MTTPAEILSPTHSWVDTIVDRRKQLASVLALLVLLGTTYSVYSAWRDHQNLKAASVIFDAMQKLERQPLPQSGKADAGWMEKSADGLKGLENAAMQHKGTVPAFEALMKLGDLHYEVGDAAKAAPYFERAVEGAPSKFFKAMALYSHGMALESLKDHKKASERFNGALSIGEPGLKAELLMALGRNSFAVGDGAKAKDYYSRAEADFPNSAVSQLAQRLKAEIK